MRRFRNASSGGHDGDPVDRLAGSFETIYAGFFAAVADRAPEQQRKLFHDNALRIYRL